MDWVKCSALNANHFSSRRSLESKTAVEGEGIKDREMQKMQLGLSEVIKKTMRTIELVIYNRSKRLTLISKFLFHFV